MQVVIDARRGLELAKTLFAMREITKAALFEDAVFATYQGWSPFLQNISIHPCCIAHTPAVTDSNTITIGSGNCGSDASATLVGAALAAASVTGTAAASEVPALQRLQLMWLGLHLR